MLFPKSEKISRFLASCALGLAVLLIGFFAVSALGMTGIHSLFGPYDEHVELVRVHLLPSLLSMGAALAALLCGRWLMEKFAGIRLSTWLLVMWFAMSMIFAVGFGVVQEIDAEMMLTTARAFAANDLSIMEETYFYYRVCPFQLDLVFIMEMLQRLLPGVNIDTAYQIINVFFGVGAIGCLAGLAERAYGGQGARHGTVLLCVLFAPMFFYNAYAYGISAMIFFCSFAMLCFARYMEEKRLRYAAAIVVSLGISYLFKANTLIAVLALGICAFLYWLESGDWKLMAAAVLALALGMLMDKAILWQYELRTGIHLNAIDDKLSWLVMGLSRSEGINAGWYNGYLANFFDAPDMSPEAQRAMNLSVLGARIPEMLAHPMETLAFFREKILTQWIEPTYYILAYGDRCDCVGHFNGLAKLFFRPDEDLHMLTVIYMTIYQRALYLLAAVGTFSVLRGKKRRASAALLPVVILGGFFYHLLFEAKSQYVFAYAVYMAPLAACGLNALANAVRRLRDRI